MKPDTATEQVDSAVSAAREALDTLEKDLRETIAALEAKLAYAESERDELKQTLDGWDEEHAGELAERDETLTMVRYWFHDILTHGRAPDRPRRLLQLVERALGHG